MKKLLTFVRHYKGLMVSMALVLAICLWNFGCESKVASPRTGQMVTRVELQLEIEHFIKEVELKIVDLDKQDAVKRELLNIGIVVAESGVNSVNPIGMVLTISGLLGMGLAVDNTKKDAIIKTLKKKASVK